MLLRLTEDDVSDVEGDGDALSRKFSDVATLFAALDPRVSRVMFGKLARAVLDLAPERRQSLLRRTILPGLLDGKIDGSVLKDFPDLDLAESLCLLLDLETAAPEVVTTALARLDLPAERQATLLPIVQAKVDARTGAVGAGRRPRCPRPQADANRSREGAQLRRVRRVRPRHGRRDPGARLDGIREAIVRSDITLARLACLFGLVRLEPNPELVQRFIAQAATHLEALEAEGRCEELAVWLRHQRELADSLVESRPDVAAVLAAGLGELCTMYRAARLVELAAHGDGRARRRRRHRRRARSRPRAGAAHAVQNQAPRTGDAGRAAAVQLLCDHAAPRRARPGGVD